MNMRMDYHLPAMLAGAALAIAALSAPAFAQASGGASYAGESVDPVSGYRCTTPFCDTVVLPDSNCLCQKLNPNESRRENLQLACTDMKTRTECPVPPR